MVSGFVGTRASLRGSKIISKNQETSMNRDLASIINWLSLCDKMIVRDGILNLEAVVLFILYRSTRILQSTFNRSIENY